MCLHELHTLASSIDAVRGRRRYPDGFLHDLRKHRDEAQRASAAFIEQAREQVGPQ
jgi:hypothetical protein